jgi:hypothetical protein
VTWALFPKDLVNESQIGVICMWHGLMPCPWLFPSSPFPLSQPSPRNKKTPPFLNFSRCWGRRAVNITGHVCCHSNAPTIIPSSGLPCSQNEARVPQSQRWTRTEGILEMFRGWLVRGSSYYWAIVSQFPFPSATHWYSAFQDRGCPL